MQGFTETMQLELYEMLGRQMNQPMEGRIFMIVDDMLDMAPSQ